MGSLSLGVFSYVINLTDSTRELKGLLRKFPSLGVKEPRRGFSKHQHDENYGENGAKKSEKCWNTYPNPPSGLEISQVFQSSARRWILSGHH